MQNVAPSMMSQGVCSVPRAHAFSILYIGLWIVVHYALTRNMKLELCIISGTVVHYILSRVTTLKRHCRFTIHSPIYSLPIVPIATGIGFIVEGGLTILALSLDIAFRGLAGTDGVAGLSVTTAVPIEAK